MNRGRERECCDFKGTRDVEREGGWYKGSREGELSQSGLVSQAF